MKTMNKKFYLVAALALLMPIMAGAQVLKGSYFLDNSFNRNKLNPAFAPNSGYFQLPAIGGINAGVLTNMEVSTFLYPRNNELYTFLHQDVSVAEFEKNLAMNPYIDVNVDMSLINFGFFTGKTFWNFETGLKVIADVDLPRDLFTFLKKGSGVGNSTVYNIGAIRANMAVNAYASLGFSREFFIPGLRLGAKARAILPAAYAGVNLNKVQLTASPEQWKLETQGNANLAMKGLTLMQEGADPSENVDFNNFSPNFDFTQIGLAGYGFSFDLGAEYKYKLGKIVSSVSASAAVTDLGMISYSQDAVSAYTSEGEISWEGINMSMGSDGSFDQTVIDNTVNKLEEQLEGLYKNLKEDKASFNTTVSSLPSFYVGAEVGFLNDKMSIGALYSARTSYHFTRHELTLSYNLTPARWFSLGVNYSCLNVQKTLGFLLEITPRIGPCIFIGTDYVFFEYTGLPAEINFPFVPMSLRLNLQFGLSFAIGGGKKALAQ